MHFAIVREDLNILAAHVSACAHVDLRRLHHSVTMMTTGFPTLLGQRVLDGVFLTALLVTSSIVA